MAGNNQSALPGQALPTPLVVRLEDQLGAPVVGAQLTATLQQGEVRFRLQVAQSDANASDLYRLDPATGLLTHLGPMGFRVLFGLQFDAAFRTLYAITGLQEPPVLVALDPTTGQGIAIAETDLHTQAESLAFTADGCLVVAGSDGNLYELNRVTGASRLIGPTGVEAVSGMSLRVFPRR